MIGVRRIGPTVPGSPAKGAPRCRVASVALLFALAAGASTAEPDAVRLSEGRLPTAKGELAGDPELLLLAAQAHRANKEQIRTWRGRASVISEATTPRLDPPQVRREATVEFVLDRQKQACRSNFVTLKSVCIADGVETPISTPMESTMVKEEAYYRYFWDPVTEREVDLPVKHIIVIDSPTKRVISGLGYDFDPMYWLSYAGGDVSELFEAYYDWVQKGEKFFPAAVSRKGDLITLEAGHDHLYNRYTVDLSQGANLTEFWGTLHPSGYSGWNYEHETVAGVWVPNKVTFTTDRGDGDVFTRTIEWLENVVNEPIPEEEFSLLKMGAKRGVEVQNHLTGTRYVLEGEEYPLREPVDHGARLREPGRRTALIVGSALLVLILVGMAVVVRRRKGTT
jgi:hypothetical protein